jgi:hypothetical protein
MFKFLCFSMNNIIGGFQKQNVTVSEVHKADFANLKFQQNCKPTTS